MSISFYNGMSGAKIFEEAIDIWGDNIANINTVGFKENIPEFATIFSSALSSSAVTSDMGMQNTIQSTAMDTSMGALKKTDNPFDLAIGGKGWFKVSYNKEEYYTKNGTFTRDKDGYLVNDSGAYLLVANAGNIIKTKNGYEINRNIDTHNLITTKKLSPISLPNNLILPALPTKNVKISLNLNSSDKINSTSPAKESNDFSALYNQYGEDMKIRDNQSFVIGYGDNVSFDGRIGYEICIDNDTLDGKNVNFDFSVNGKHITLTLPDGSTKTDIQNALKEKLDNLKIENEITQNGIKIYNKDELIIKSNTPLVKNVSAKKVIYKSTPKKENEFNTIKSFEDIIKNLAQNVYKNADISFDKNGQFVIVNNSKNQTINSFILKTDNSNENLYKAFYPLFNKILPQTSAKSIKLQINNQKIGGSIYTNEGKDILTFDFSKQKVLPSKTIWNLNTIIKDEYGNIIDTKTFPLEFNEDGFLLTPKKITINTPQNIDIDLSAVTSFEKVNSKINYTFSQDGEEKGYLTSYQIEEDGTINAYFSNNKSVSVGAIPLFNFKNEQGLLNIGKSLFQETQNSSKGEIVIKNNEYIPTAKIKSGFLETSNVNMTKAMTELLVNQKAFASAAKTVTTSDEMIKKAIDMKR